MMDDQNTMGRIKYVLEHFFWGSLASFWYLILIFKRIRGYTLITSLLILFIVVALASLVFGYFDFRKKRNAFSVFFNLISGFGIYTVVSYLPIRGGLIKTILIVSAFVSAFCCMYIMNRMITKGGNRRKIILKGIKSTVYSAGRVFGLGLAAIVIAQVIYGVRHHYITGDIYDILEVNVVRSDAVVYDQQDVEKQTIANNIETIALLEAGRWNGLSAQERVDVLQVVGNIERRYLGLPHELYVVAKDIEEGISGKYNDESHQVIIDLDYLMSYDPEYVLETVLHECHHAYAHRCRDAYNAADDESKSLRLFKKGKKYGIEFENYIGANEDREEYHKQECEIDANNYAQDAKKDYLNKIKVFYASEKAGTRLRQ